MKTQQLAAMPVPGFAPQTVVTVGDALLLEWAAPSSSFAVGVLQQRIAGTPGAKVDLDRVRNRLAKINKGLAKVGNRSMKWFSQQSVAQRLASPFFMPSGSSCPEVLTAAQQDKTDAACAEANAACAKAAVARPGARFCYAAPRLYLPAP